MPVLKYRIFCVVSFANVKNIGFLNVYQYSRNLKFSQIGGCVHQYTILERDEFCGYYACDIKRISQKFLRSKSTDMLE